jgi:uncharacterized protein (TIGR00251 family)
VADSVELTPIAAGTRLRLRVKPGARKTAIVGVHGGALKIAVNAPPQRGKANEAVIELLADVLDLPASSIEIVGGGMSQNKVVAVKLAADLVRERLANMV